MRMPSYMRVGPVEHKDGVLVTTVQVKWWGWLFLLWNAWRQGLLRDAN